MFCDRIYRRKNIEDTLFATKQQYGEKECFELIKKLTTIVCYIHKQDGMRSDIRIPNIVLRRGRLIYASFWIYIMVGCWLFQDI